MSFPANRALTTALLVINVQNDLAPGGQLAVPGGGPADAGSGRAIDRVERDRRPSLCRMAHTRFFSGQ